MMTEEKKEHEEVPSNDLPAVTDAEKILELENELKEAKDKYVRSLAEMENTRKRMLKEKQDTTRFVIEDVIGEFLSPIDNLENALAYTDKMSEETRNWARGFQMILDQFKEVLSSHGVTSFTSKGTHFDPHRHEAVETEETDTVPEGTILKEFVRGYKSGDRTIRPARVQVAKKPAENPPKDQQNNNN